MKHIYKIFLLFLVIPMISLAAVQEEITYRKSANFPNSTLIRIPSSLMAPSYLLTPKEEDGGFLMKIEGTGEIFQNFVIPVYKYTIKGHEESNQAYNTNSLTGTKNCLSIPFTIFSACPKQSTNCIAYITLPDYADYQSHSVKSGRPIKKVGYDSNNKKIKIEFDQDTVDDFMVEFRAIVYKENINLKSDIKIEIQNKTKNPVLSQTGKVLDAECVSNSANNGTYENPLKIVTMQYDTECGEDIILASLGNCLEEACNDVVIEYTGTEQFDVKEIKITRGSLEDSPSIKNLFIEKNTESSLIFEAEEITKGRIDIKIYLEPKNNNSSQYEVGYRAYEKPYEQYEDKQTLKVKNDCYIGPIILIQPEADIAFNSAPITLHSAAYVGDMNWAEVEFQFSVMANGSEDVYIPAAIKENRIALSYAESQNGKKNKLDSISFACDASLVSIYGKRAYVIKKGMSANCVIKEKYAPIEGGNYRFRTPELMIMNVRSGTAIKNIDFASKWVNIAGNETDGELYVDVEYIMSDRCDGYVNLTFDCKKAPCGKVQWYSNLNDELTVDSIWKIGEDHVYYLNESGYTIYDFPVSCDKNGECSLGGTINLGKDGYYPRIETMSKVYRTGDQLIRFQNCNI